MRCTHGCTLYDYDGHENRCRWVYGQDSNFVVSSEREFGFICTWMPHFKVYRNYPKSAPAGSYRIEVPNITNIVFFSSGHVSIDWIVDGKILERTLFSRVQDVDDKIVGARVEYFFNEQGETTKSELWWLDASGNERGRRELPDKMIERDGMTPADATPRRNRALKVGRLDRYDGFVADIEGVLSVSKRPASKRSSGRRILVETYELRVYAPPLRDRRRHTADLDLSLRAADLERRVSRRRERPNYLQRQAPQQAEEANRVLRSNGQMSTSFADAQSTASDESADGQRGRSADVVINAICSLARMDGGDWRVPRSSSDKRRDQRGRALMAKTNLVDTAAAA